MYNNLIKSPKTVKNIIYESIHLSESLRDISQIDWQGEV